MHLICPHCHNPIAAEDTPAREEHLCPSCGQVFRIETEPTVNWKGHAGRSFGRFRLDEPVGSGAFGTVFRAHDPHLDRTVAVKIPRAGSLIDAEDLDRFLREGRSAAGLRHPGIVPVHEVGVADGVPYLVSEYVAGPSLADALAAAPFPPREAAVLVAKVADALHHAHGQRVVHRDVKPSNILLDAKGEPHLVDFGMARREAGEITVTREGQVLGTPAYMSPEQARGEAHRVDGRTDVYSLGVVLYRLLTGELPFRGNTRMLLHQILNDEPRLPRRLNDHVPRDLETICLKAMEKPPDRRYPTAQALAEDLRRWQNGESIRARPVGRVEKAWRWCRRKPGVAIPVAVIALLLVALTTVSALFALHQRDARLELQAAHQQAIDAGALEIVYPDRVHARVSPATLPPMLDNGEPVLLNWLIYLPKAGHYRMVVATAGIPVGGFPQPGLGHLLPIEFAPEQAGTTVPVSLVFFEAGGEWAMKVVGIPVGVGVTMGLPLEHTQNWGKWGQRRKNPLENQLGVDTFWVVSGLNHNRVKSATFCALDPADRMELFRWEAYAAKRPWQKPVPGSPTLAGVVVWIEPVPGK